MGARPWRPGLRPRWASPPLAACQRYLDEAEREKQQYMKELRAYQQSEAYKMCTEKIQEKKIKKGGKGPTPRQPVPAPGWVALAKRSPTAGLTLWGRGGGCSRQGEHHMTTCRAGPCQRRPGRLTLPSLLPRQRTPAPGSRTPS